MRDMGESPKLLSKYKRFDLVDDGMIERIINIERRMRQNKKTGERGKNVGDQGSGGQMRKLARGHASPGPGGGSLKPGFYRLGWIVNDAKSGSGRPRTQ